jgi:hypothetical protein
MADDRRREPVSVIERFGFLHRAILRDRFGNVTMPRVVPSRRSIVTRSLVQPGVAGAKNRSAFLIAGASEAKETSAIVRAVPAKKAATKKASTGR